MSERDLWHTVKRALKTYGRLERIESPLVKGVPDVVYSLFGVTGWLELKYLEAWPKRSTTPVRIDHLTLTQVLFLEGWTMPPAQGHAYLLLQVGQTYLLLSPSTARGILECRLTRVEVELAAVARGKGRFPTVAVLRALRGLRANDGAAP